MNSVVLGVVFATTAFVVGCAMRGESGHSSDAARTTKANAMSKNATGRYATVNGLKIYHEIHGAADGKNPPLVLLHGGGSTIGTSFGKLLSSFAKTRQSDGCGLAPERTKILAILYCDSCSKQRIAKSGCANMRLFATTSQPSPRLGRRLTSRQSLRANSRLGKYEAGGGSEGAPFSP
jgi:hypothetical protein